MGKFNAKTQQPIGAASQWLTAALVMTFVQDGKISLDDKVSDYLPVFALHGKSYITIRQCLTHNTGIQSEEGVGKFFQRNKFKTLEDAVNDFAAKREIQTNPGTEFRYSNIGFNIAGRVLEVVTKRTFDHLMQERILRPLGMRNTTFSNEDYNDALNPNTGARSTASDYINFLAMLLNKGNFNGKTILSESSVALILTQQATGSQVKNAPVSVEGLSYGLGDWILETNTRGSALALTSPSLKGTWPFIDLCRGYACILFTKELSGEQKKDLFLNIKATVDKAMPVPSCN